MTKQEMSALCAELSAGACDLEEQEAGHQVLKVDAQVLREARKGEPAPAPPPGGS